MSIQISHDVERSRHDLIATAQPSKTNTTSRAIPLTSSACSFQEQRRRGRQRSTETTAWRTAAGRQLQQKARSVRRDLHEFGRENKITLTPSQRLLGNLLREHGDARVLMTVQSQEVVVVGEESRLQFPVALSFRIGITGPDNLGLSLQVTWSDCLGDPRPITEQALPGRKMLLPTLTACRNWSVCALFSPALNFLPSLLLFSSHLRVPAHSVYQCSFGNETAVLSKPHWFRLSVATAEVFSEALRRRTARR